MTQYRPRSGSNPGTGRSSNYSGVAGVHSLQESAILVAVRKQLEAMEEKFTAQINKVQQQSDRLRDAAFSRVDSKMSSMEALQPKLDRRLAELSGNYKGLSDEMQSQIRRIDQMDSRLWEWRHSFEEEIRAKFSELEQNHQQASSAVRLANATSEDSTKRVSRRLQRLEGLEQDRLVSSEDTTQSLLNLHARLTELEDCRNQESALFADHQLVLSSSGQPGNQLQEAPAENAMLVALETRLTDASQKLELCQSESNQVHSRLEAQEERMKSLRTLIETKDEHHRWLTEKVERADWEGKFKELNLQVHSLEQTRLGTEETLSLVRKQLSAQEETQEDLLDLCGRLQGSVLPPDDHSQEMGQGSSLAVGVRERLSEQEERLQALSSEMNLLRGDAELIPRVAMLVTTLKQVAPKVMDHELCLRDVLEKVGGLEIQLQMERAIDKASDRSQQFDSMVARTSRLEVELARITAEVEGGPTEAPSGPDEESPDEAGTATSRKLLGGIGTSAMAAMAGSALAGSSDVKRSASGSPATSVNGSPERSI